MTAAIGFLQVADHVARNPIARAVAAARLREAVRVFATRLYLLADGELVPDDGSAAAKTLYVAWLVLFSRGQQDGADGRVMRGAISTIEQLAGRSWAWRTADASAIDAGLRRARAVFDHAQPDEVRTAWAELDGLERAIQRKAEAVRNAPPHADGSLVAIAGAQP